MLVSPCNQSLHARSAIPSRYGDTWFQVRSLGRGSRLRVQHQTPPFGFSFPPPGPAGPVPRLHQYYEGATTSSRPSCRTSFPSFGSTSVALDVSLLDGRVHRRGLELVTRLLHPGIAEETTGSPKFLRNQLSVCTCSNPTPAGLLAPDHFGCSSVALGHRRAKAPTKGLSTLNSMAFELAVYASQ